MRRLAEFVGGLQDKTIEIHASTAYTDPTADLLVSAGATVAEPLAGLRQGQRLAWYNGADAVPTAAKTFAPIDVSEYVALLRDESATRTPEQILMTRGDGPRPGACSQSDRFNRCGAEALDRLTATNTVHHGSGPGCPCAIDAEATLSIVNASQRDHHTAEKATETGKSVRHCPNLFADLRGQPASRLFEYTQTFADVQKTYSVRHSG